jgi:hypothetical protein
VLSKSVLLRVLLSLSLLLNGSGYAAAAAQTQDESPSASTAHARPQVDESSPCPGHARAPAANPQVSEPDSAQHKHDKPACCKSAQCVGACLQHVPAAIVGAWIAPAAITHGDADRQSKSAHPAPALPDRNRPPIA